MRTVSLIALLLVLLCGSASLAVEVSEVNMEVSVATDPDTGQPILRFTVWLEYAPVPPYFSFATTWTTYMLDGGEKTVLRIEEHPARESPGVRFLYSSSPWIPIEPGVRYGATCHYEDSVHGLTFDRTFSYSAPVSLPIGIRLRGWDGSDRIDLGGVPDEEIEELALYYHGLASGYTVVEEEVSLESFLDNLTGSASFFPVAVILIPTAGVQIRIGPSVKRRALNVGQYAYLYVLPDADAIAGFRDQLSSFDREFVGLSFAGAGGTMVLGARTVFVDTMAWDVLAAADLEQSERAEETDS